MIDSWKLNDPSGMLNVDWAAREKKQENSIAKLFFQCPQTRT